MSNNGDEMTNKVNEMNKGKEINKEKAQPTVKMTNQEETTAMLKETEKDKVIPVAAQTEKEKEEKRRRKKWITVRYTFFSYGAGDISFLKSLKGFGVPRGEGPAQTRALLKGLFSPTVFLCLWLGGACIPLSPSRRTPSTVFHLVR